MSFGKQSAPPAPDYTAAANATAAGNLEAAKYATAANRVNQVGPYGNLTYTKSVTPGTFDEAGYNAALAQYNASPGGIMKIGAMGAAPTKDQFTKAGEDIWTATQSLSPEQQKLKDIQDRLSQTYGETGEAGMNAVKELFANPSIDESKLAQMPQNAGMSTQQAMMERLRPDIERQRAQMDTQLANQGIQQGSEAWKNAKEQQGREFSDRENQAALAGIQTDMAARNQGIANQSAIMNQPLNMINALRTGSQVTPQSYVNPAQQATTAGADLLGATSSLYNTQSANVNAANAGNAQMWGGLMGMGGAALGGRK